MQWWTAGGNWVLTVVRRGYTPSLCVVYTDTGSVFTLLVAETKNMCCPNSIEYYWDRGWSDGGLQTPVVPLFVCFHLLFSVQMEEKWTWICSQINTCTYQLTVIKNNSDTNGPLRPDRLTHTYTHTHTHMDGNYGLHFGPAELLSNSKQEEKIPVGSLCVCVCVCACVCVCVRVCVCVWLPHICCPFIAHTHPYGAHGPPLSSRF